MTSFSRRQFLQTAAGTAALGCGVSLFAQEKKSPNDKIGVAIVGLGSRGNDHVKAFSKDPRSVILYLCDPDESRHDAKRAEKIAETQDGIKPKYLHDMRQALDDKAVDVVTVASTNHWHALHGLWAMQAGKHAYVEKPLSYNIHEGKVLTAAAKKYGRIVQTGTQCRSNPANIEATKFVHDGGIGDATVAHCILYTRRSAIGSLGDYPIPEKIDYEIWCGPAPKGKLTRPRVHYDWHWQRLFGNGDIGNRGPHQTDLARWHLGLNRYPNSVFTVGGRVGYQAEKKDPNYVEAGDTMNNSISVLDYGDKTIVFEMRALPTERYFGGLPNWKGIDFGVAIHGSKGHLMQIDYGHSIAFDLDGNVLKEFKGANDQFHYENFLTALEKNDPNVLTAPVREGELSAAVCHLMDVPFYLGEQNKVSPKEIAAALPTVKGLDTKKMFDEFIAYLDNFGVDLGKTPLSLGPKLAVDSKSETFADNAEANKRLSRPEYRAPFQIPSPSDV